MQLIEPSAKAKTAPQDDPEAFFNQLGPREVGILFEFVKLWTKNVQELLARLRETNPSESMLSEVHYWRDLARVLDAINLELKQQFVEVTMQVLLGSQEPSHSALLQ